MDDEPAIRRLLTVFLSQAGYTVESAENGHEGLEKFRSCWWDLVVTDRSMPVMDGEEMAASIRQTAPGVPIILLTGTPGLIFEEAQFAAVLTKPGLMQDLLGTIARCLA